MADPPSIKNLTEYLCKKNSKNGSMVLTFDETEEVDEEAQIFPWEGEKLPWNSETCFVVVYYAMKFLSSCDHPHGTLSNTIRRLDDLASQLLVLDKPWRYSDLKVWTAQEMGPEEFPQLYVNSFMSEVQLFFNVPKQLPDDNSLLNKHEILAGFMDFLLQILDCEARTDSRQQFDALQKELTFLLTLLGDVPLYQCSTQLEREQVRNNILAEFEVLANEAGTFIYSSIFATHLIKASRFYDGRDSLLRLVALLNEKIKDHCSGQLSELVIIPSTTPKADAAIDSLFIVESLLEDLESLMNRRILDETIKDQMKTIHEEMTFAQTFLKGIDQMGMYHKDGLKESSFQIRDVAYEAEYLVNSYAIGNLPVWYMSLRLPIVIHKIKLLNATLEEIMKISDVEVLRATEDFNKKLHFQASEATVDVNDTVLVGIQEEKSKILEDLTTGSKSRRILSIFGLPGLGKTTMANILFNDPLCCEYFDERASCVVSQTYQKKNVLLDIFMSLTASKSGKLDKENVSQMGNELVLEIYQRLKGKRYLILLDDVWDSNVWDDLRTCFPDDANGSRIIITSRIKDVAPIGTTTFYPLRLLTKDQCWDLLQKKVFVEKPCPPQLLCIGKEIALECQGLPLTVIVVAGILAKLAEEESVWRKVKSNLDSYVFDDPEGCLKVLELSYEYLPNHLKLCFLYFGAFPEDVEIGTRKLVWSWVAEGFIPKHEEKCPESVAQEYLLDLINRSLVIIGKRRFNGAIKTCSIHDLLHDMCIRKANEGNFLKLIKDRESSIYERHQRLFVPPLQDSPRSFGLHCRSLVGPLSCPSPSISHMPLLRVFHQEYAPEEIYRLVSLRYLFVDRLAHPPTIIDKLVNLEVLGLGNKIDLMLSTILKMVKLRHIYSKYGTKIIKNCNDTSQRTNLKSLGEVLIKDYNDEEVLRRSPYLRKLKCFCRGLWLPDLRSLTQLESLNLDYNGPIRGEVTYINFPTTIRKLTFGGVRLPWEEFSKIGRLPNLWCLSLESSVFVGEQWETKDGEFQELRFLTLKRFVQLKQWITSSEHFPKLQSLVLDSCTRLQEIPSELGNISTLQTIEVVHSSFEASMSAVRIEKEQREYGNEELKVIISHSDWSKEQLLRECEEE